MKTLNRLLLVAAATLVVGGVPATQAGEPYTVTKTAKNSAFFASPRYLEAHPELLHGQPPGVESLSPKVERLAKPTENTALAGSPRYRETHPALRWATSSADQIAAQNIGQSYQLSKLTQNRALATSPRFLEQHPELLHSEPVLEIAPLK
jgi:hypothetical protein